MQTKILLVACLLFLVAATPNDQQIVAVQGLIKRLLPNYTNLFKLDLLNSTIDVFEIETTNNYLTLRGNNGVSLASALHHYLKYYCNCQVSWEADQLNITSPAPIVSPKIRITTPNKYRYYMNTCTHGYSAVWWDWARWEREIDWMALHGINMPLMFTGQEKILFDVYTELNVSTDDYFTGPAFLPWNRMGNVNGWGGVLSQEWMQEQFVLAKQILERERQFGMLPVLPGFNGYVPPQLKQVYPSSQIDQLEEWNEFPGTFYLNPLDPLFATIASKISQQVVSQFGPSHYYNVDPFNEEVPPSKDPSYLSSVAKALYQPLIDADPQAIWVLQGWFLYDKQQFWQKEQRDALLGSVPHGRLIVLDLWAEEFPVWNRTDSFNNQEFVWNMLHNFGERPGMFGYLSTVRNGPYEARKQFPKTMQGIGLTMEGIHQNPVMYDFLTDQVWRHDPVDIDKWIQQYANRRYRNATQGVQQAWKLMRDIVYDLKVLHFGPALLIIGHRPTIKPYERPQWDINDFRKVMNLMIVHGEYLRKNDGYKYDIIDITSQALNDFAILVHEDLLDAYQAGNLEKVNEKIDLLRSIIIVLDRVLASGTNTLLGTWLRDSKKWSTSASGLEQLETNARLQITSWSHAGSGLQQYAYKMWGGLVKGFYAQRWEIFFTEIVSSLKEKKSFDVVKYEKNLDQWDTDWVKQRDVYPVDAVGDPYDIASKIYDKYFK
jgi:alpha-N-acetylglucosaminidase